MNKQTKVIVSGLGACNVVFDIMTPIALASLITTVTEITAFNSVLLMVVAFAATAFRAIKFFIK